jgi:hypothetical protein
MAFAARTLARRRELAVSIPGWLRIGGSTWLGTRLVLGAAVTGAYCVGHFVHVHLSANRWDTVWYIDIAQHGYVDPQTPNFFPLLPILQAGIGRVLAGGRVPSHADVLAAGLGVSALATFVAFCALAALVQLEEDERTAGAAVRLLAAYPLAMFLAAAYTDASFLAVTLIFFLCVRTRLWWVAALAGLAAGLLRPVAPVLSLALLAELALEVARRRTDRATVKGRLLASAGPLAGTGLFAAYLWWRFGDPLRFVHTQTHYWNHVATWPWVTLADAATKMLHPDVYLVLDFSLVIAFGALSLLMLVRMRPVYGFLTGGLVLAILVSPQPDHKDVVQSAGRYLLAAFPAFWMVARWVKTRPWLEYALVATGFTLQASLAVLFLLGGQIY